MSFENMGFDQSVQRQIAINRRLSATGRMLALRDLLDAARALAPTGHEARERRLRALAEHIRERERWREQYRRLSSSQRTDAASSI